MARVSYFHTSVPVLALRSENDFIKTGEALFRDVNDFISNFVDSEHFALETHTYSR